jgi:hypothetical protein
MQNDNLVLGIFTGGLIFGWNALAIMLKAQGNFDRGCTQAIEGAPLAANVK